MYSFLFDRRSMALLVAGMVVAGLLLFASGVFVGLQLQIEGSEPVAVARFRPMGPAEPGPSEPAAGPAPATSGQPDAPPAGSPPAAEPPDAPPPATAEPPAVPAPLASAGPPDDPPQRALVAAEPVSAPRARPAVLDDRTSPMRVVPAWLRAPTPPLSGAVRPAVDETVPVFTHAELLDDAGEPTYGVQVAAFRLRSTASHIAAELRRRGWEAYLVPFEIAPGRPWHSVRFGRFSSGSEAYSAARDFENREGVPTLVRLQLRGD